VLKTEEVKTAFVAQGRRAGALATEQLGTMPRRDIDAFLEIAESAGKKPRSRAERAMQNPSRAGESQDQRDQEQRNDASDLRDQRRKHEADRGNHDDGDQRQRKKFQLRDPLRRDNGLTH
jgi:hypothetical protein